METWKHIDGYDRYEVSDCGRVRTKEGRFMSFMVHHKGYFKVELSKNGEGKGHFVHRLVAKAFIDNPENKPQVNHKDTDKQNNRIGNLEWATQLENVDHAFANRLMSVFKQSKNVKILTDEQIHIIRDAKFNRNFTRKDLCKSIGVSIHVVKDIRSKRSWAHR